AFILRLFPLASARKISADAPLLEKRPTAPQGSSLIKVDKARKTFGGLVAVNDVSFEVTAGQIVGLIGPNGAGKSTTFDLITGMNSLTSGTVSFAGKQLSGRSPRDTASQGIARTCQHPKILPDMTVLENVALGAHQRGHSGVAKASFGLSGAKRRPFSRKRPPSLN